MPSTKSRDILKEIFHGLRGWKDSGFDYRAREISAARVELEVNHASAGKPREKGTVRAAGQGVFFPANSTGIARERSAAWPCGRGGEGAGVHESRICIQSTVRAESGGAL